MISIISQITLIVTSFSALLYFSYRYKVKSGKKDAQYSLLTNPRFAVYNRYAIRTVAEQ